MSAPARSGIGYDSHRLVSGRRLIIGGVEIPFELGLDGHSDSDVLTHAVIDALLGAAGLGDIGRHFPDSDERYRDADSLELLRQAVTLLAAERLTVVNVDATVVLERPKLVDYSSAMRLNLATALGLDRRAVNVKATSGEAIGFVGRGEGAAALAIATVMAAS